MLRNDTPFTWPMASSVECETINLESPFQRPGCGFVVAARVSPEREMGYVAALNRDFGLALVYCFSREDFPWIAIWEENCARADEPWKGVTQVRGMEFGTTPMPVGRDAIRKMGNLFGTPGSRFIPAGAKVHARYVACIVRVPASWNAISEIAPAQNSLTLIGPHNGERVSIAAEGLLDFLSKGSAEA